MLRQQDPNRKIQAKPIITCPSLKEDDVVFEKADKAQPPHDIEHSVSARQSRLLSETDLLKSESNYHFGGELPDLDSGSLQSPMIPISQRKTPRSLTRQRTIKVFQKITEERSMSSQSLDSNELSNDKSNHQ